MDLEKLKQIKKLAIISMFSDDTLMDTLVLKGGNALDIVYKISHRASIDLDFSIEKELNPLEVFSKKMFDALTRTFKENGYRVFDIYIIKKPQVYNPSAPESWGGYQIEFKLIEKENFSKFEEDIENLRRNATIVGPNQKRKFSIDISKCEYCDNKKAFDLEGFTIYVYSPEMIVFEKLRAICQQMPEYIQSIGKSYQTARARDFFDIYVVIKHFKIDIKSKDNIMLLKEIFNKKEVPLELIAKIKNYREYHREDFAVIRDTVTPEAKLRDFDFYFDFVVKICQELSKVLGII